MQCFCETATARREENQNMHRQCEEGMKHGVATVVAWIYGSLELCSMDALTVFDEMLMTDICAGYCPIYMQLCTRPLYALVYETTEASKNNTKTMAKKHQNESS